MDKFAEILTMFFSRYTAVLIALIGVSVFCAGMYRISTTVGLIVSGIILVVIALILEANQAENSK